MIPEEYTFQLESTYGSIFESDLQQEISESAFFKNVEVGEEIMRPGQYIRSMPLLLSGTIKILRPDDEGDQLLLYYLEQGQSCAMSMACCMGRTKSEVYAVAETVAQVLMIPLEKMEEWAAKYKTWRHYAFGNYHTRLMEMLESIDSIAFHNLPDRLESYLELKARVTGSNDLLLTHQEIAQELNTSRVVVSRLLKALEKKDKISLHRKFITML